MAILYAACRPCSFQIATAIAAIYSGAATDQNGPFTMNGLSPGVYKMFAWEELEPLAYFDLEILRRYELQAKSVTVSESSKLNVQVKVIPAEQ